MIVQFAYYNFKHIFILMTQLSLWHNLFPFGPLTKRLHWLRQWLSAEQAITSPEPVMAMFTDFYGEKWTRGIHGDVIKWKHFPRYWPFVRGIYRSPVNSPHKGQWRGALMFSVICVWIHGWVNNREAGDFRRYRAHYDVIVMGSALYFVHSTCVKLWN